MKKTVSNRITGWCRPLHDPPEAGWDAIHRTILDIGKPVFIVDVKGKIGVSSDATATIGKAEPDEDAFPLLAYTPPLCPDALGSSIFRKRYNLRYAFLVGAMANGISSVKLVKAAGKAGMLGFFGAAGLPLEDIKKAVLRLKLEARGLPFGINLVYSAGASERELDLVKLLLHHGIHLVSAAGYMKLTEPLLYYRINGIHRNENGKIICPNRIIAKTSRLELARQFLFPPPERLVHRLLNRGLISESEAALAKHIPIANDLTVEADSAGHTDNRPAISLLPAVLDLRNELYKKFNYDALPCIGLAGGIATPLSVSAAFCLGADYVLTGSINQACVEAGTSDIVREMLAGAGQADVAMAPSANMFERGIRVQVLKKGTMFPQRASKLYQFYRTYNSFDQIPEDQKKEIEEKLFQNSFEEEWRNTRKFFEIYDPKQTERAADNPRHKMALVFRSYLGKSSRWAITGDPARKRDYQVWCGPSMGAFNRWARGSFLEDPKNRLFETVSMNLLFGACVVIRRQNILNFGVLLPPHTGRFVPMPLPEIYKKLKFKAHTNLMQYI